MQKVTTIALLLFIGLMGNVDAIESINISGETVTLTRALNGTSHVYLVAFDQPTQLSVKVLTPRPVEKNVTYTIHITDDSMNILFYNSSYTATWDLVSKGVARSKYVQSPVLTGNLQAGEYRIVIGNEDSRGEYTLVVGKGAAPFSEEKSPRILTAEEQKKVIRSTSILMAAMLLILFIRKIVKKARHAPRKPTYRYRSKQE